MRKLVKALLRCVFGVIVVVTAAACGAGCVFALVARGPMGDGIGVGNALVILMPIGALVGIIALIPAIRLYNRAAESTRRDLPDEDNYRDYAG